MSMNIFERFPRTSVLQIDYAYLTNEEALGLPEDECEECHGQDPNCRLRLNLHNVFNVRIYSVIISFYSNIIGGNS